MVKNVKVEIETFWPNELNQRNSKFFNRYTFKYLLQNLTNQVEFFKKIIQYYLQWPVLLTLSFHRRINCIMIHDSNTYLSSIYELNTHPLFNPLDTIICLISTTCPPPPYSYPPSSYPLTNNSTNNSTSNSYSTNNSSFNYPSS